MQAYASPVTQLNLGALLELSMCDQGLLHQLARDPLGVLAGFGVKLDSEMLKQWMGITGATDAELVEVVRARIGAHENCNCG